MQPPVQTKELPITERVVFDTNPDEYKHWTLSIAESTAILSMDVNEDEGLKPGYKLKLNSYDLGVDIEPVSYTHLRAHET